MIWPDARLALQLAAMQGSANVGLMGLYLH